MAKGIRRRPDLGGSTTKLPLEIAQQLRAEGGTFRPRRIDYSTTVYNFLNHPTEAEQKEQIGLSPLQLLEQARRRVEGLIQAHGFEVSPSQRGDIQREIDALRKGERGL